MRSIGTEDGSRPCSSRGLDRSGPEDESSTRGGRRSGRPPALAERARARRAPTGSGGSSGDLDNMDDQSAGVVRVQLDGGCVLISVVGEFDMRLHDSFVQAVERGGGDVVVDLSETTFLD